MLPRLCRLQVVAMLGKLKWNFCGGSLLYEDIHSVVLYYDVCCAILCVDIDTGQAEKMPDHGGN